MFKWILVRSKYWVFNTCFLSVMFRFVGIRVRFSWCSSIFQVLSKHLLEEGMDIALLMDQPCTFLFSKFNVKTEKTNVSTSPGSRPKKSGLLPFQTCKSCMSKACKTCRGPTAKKSSTYTKIAATWAHSPNAAKSGKSLSSGSRTVGGRVRHGARTTNHKLG